MGKFDFRKQFDLALDTVSLVKESGATFEFHVVSPIDSDVQRQMLTNKIARKGLTANVVLHGRIPNARVHELMQVSDVLLFTSIMEGTPHVVLEAIQNNLPVICHDACGHGDVVNESIGIKIQVSSSKKAPTAFAKAMLSLITKPWKLSSMKRSAIIRQHQLAWDNKAKSVMEIYNDLYHQP